MRLLLSAFACEPRAGSEPGNGWTWAETLSRTHEVTVITDGAHRAPIEAELAAVPNDRLKVHYIGEGPAGYLGFDIYPYYFKWQEQAADLAARLHVQQPFQMVHHVTYGMHRAPSYMFRLGIPFVWGPIGGAEDVNPLFYTPGQITPKESAKELVRWAWNQWCRVDPRLKATADGASVIGVTTPDTARSLPCRDRRKAVILPSSVLNPADLREIARHRAQGGPATGLSLAFTGRLLGWKGPVLALRAFARYAATHPTANLHYYGEGPLEGYLKAEAAKLGLGGRVVFHGKVPRAEMLGAYARHNAFFFPSRHDSSGCATLEAQAAGLPVVCLDAGGPGMQVSPQAGVKVKPTTPARVERDLAAALARLTADPAFWQRCSDAARAHALNPATTPDIFEMIRRLYGPLNLPGLVPPAPVNREAGGELATTL
ncbi:MAG TPA: glycosyltransferase [Deinococcales bacterium]|nr:glycosyltransferase [Deinococcales bacterium]